MMLMNRLCMFWFEKSAWQWSFIHREALWEFVVVDKDQLVFRRCLVAVLKSLDRLTPFDGT